jgi:hypothetical protein
VRNPAGADTVRLTGTVCVAPGLFSGAIATEPVYEPAARLPEFTITKILAVVSALFGLTDSQSPPVTVAAVAVNRTLPPPAEMVIACCEPVALVGVGCWNPSALGLTVIALGAVTIRVTGTTKGLLLAGPEIWIDPE